MKFLKSIVARGRRASLDDLGITYTYDSAKTDSSPYDVRLNPERMSSPLKSEAYLREVVMAVADDFRAKGGSLEISVEPKYKDRLVAVASDLLERGKGEEDKRSFITSGFVAVPMVVLGAAGLVFGYDNCCELATYVANHINHNGSHLLAPVAGISQTAISLGGTVLATFIGAEVGTLVGDYASRPFKRIFTPHGIRVKEYEQVKEALSHPGALRALPAEAEPPAEVVVRGDVPRENLEGLVDGVPPVAQLTTEPPEGTTAT